MLKLNQLLFKSWCLRASNTYIVVFGTNSPQICLELNVCTVLLQDSELLTVLILYLKHIKSRRAHINSQNWFWSFPWFIKKQTNKTNKEHTTTWLKRHKCLKKCRFLLCCNLDFLPLVSWFNKTNLDGQRHWKGILSQELEWKKIHLKKSKFRCQWQMNVCWSYALKAKKAHKTLKT